MFSTLFNNCSFIYIFSVWTKYVQCLLLQFLIFSYYLSFIDIFYVFAELFSKSSAAELLHVIKLKQTYDTLCNRHLLKTLCEKKTHFYQDTFQYFNRLYFKCRVKWFETWMNCRQWTLFNLKIKFVNELKTSV